MPRSHFETDWPDLYREIEDRAPADPALAEALRDYEKTAARLAALCPGEEDWGDWAEIRDELVQEIARLSRVPPGSAARPTRPSTTQKEPEI